ncbi:uncharacterized protein LOC125701544 isoform X1 [Lagopus muta]|uniref:uncharacterized protein LOC125701544 isoform X1 n=1 Tax=Lagopus muta TaxID=64668 RepID=UPI00209FBB0E|nr:uncharacterized protein LOC125701544 isoform X1 [Lagopus muta]
MVAEHWASAGGREGEERGKTPRRKGGGHFELLQWEELEQLVQSMQPYRIGECQGQPPSPRLQLDELPLCAQTVGCAAVLGCTAPAESPLPALQLHPCFFASHTKPQGLSCRSVFTLRMLSEAVMEHLVRGVASPASTGGSNLPVGPDRAELGSTPSLPIFKGWEQTGQHSAWDLPPWEHWEQVLPFGMGSVSRRSSNCTWRLLPLECGVNP